ncbi:MAG: S24 family peptidase [Acidobacteriaceae bacterium]|nr:S24 family peptidase [Acidobacteriaceae bacterium]MBV9778450.1 S24 family peptidase [Acidobacteriaceae bacterium]
MSTPARVIRFDDFAPKPGEYSLLQAELPGRGVETIGVLLLDPAADTLHIRLRRDWESFASPEDAEVLSELQDDLASQARERGGSAVLEHLEDVAAQSIRITDREAITVRNFDKTLSELYREHVGAKVLSFRTHLPRYSLAVAAGPFLTNPEDIRAHEWIETPPDLKLDENMFVAQIRGKSMEPRIPDGSLCVFRRNVVGSRNGRLVLVRNSELADDNQYTVKRYKSEKTVTEEGFAQTRIRLESLNPAYPSWDLDEEEGKYQIIAEFVRVLE